MKTLVHVGLVAAGGLLGGFGAVWAGGFASSNAPSIQLHVTAPSAESEVSAGRASDNQAPTRAGTAPSDGTRGEGEDFLPLDPAEEAEALRKLTEEKVREFDGSARDAAWAEKNEAALDGSLARVFEQMKIGASVTERECRSGTCFARVSVSKDDSGKGLAGALAHHLTDSCATTVIKSEPGNPESDELVFVECAKGVQAI